MVFAAAVLFIAASIWVLIRTRKPAVQRPLDVIDDAFDGEDARSLFETAPIGLMEIDREGIVRRVNRLECKLRGLEESALLGVHCAELVPEVERARYREQIQRKLDGQTALVTYQREYQHEGVRKIAVEVHEQLFRGRNGLIAGLRMASIDITERKKSAQAAYQNATELRALFQAFPDLFLRLD